jgi:hypothetical protein
MLAGILLIWGTNLLLILTDIPNWSEDFTFTVAEQETFNKIIPILHLGYLTSTIISFIFSSVFVIVAYGVYKKESWVWSTGLIFSTIFLAIFSLLLASFMINTLIFKDDFSISGLTTVIIAFLITLGIVFFNTRPAAKLYFELDQKK